MGNKNLEEARNNNQLLRHDTAYDKTEEEMIKHLVYKKGVDTNIFIDRDRTTDLIRGVDEILNYMPEGKEISFKDKTLNELSNVHIHPINEIKTGNNNLVSIEKLVANLKDSASKEYLSSYVKETNEGLIDKNNSTFTLENSQLLLLGNFKASDYNTPQRCFTMINSSNEINNSVIPNTTSYIISNITDSVSVKYSLQTRNKVVNPYLSRNNSDTRSISSLPQVKKGYIFRYKRSQDKK